MAYARIIFPSSTTFTARLKDLARFCAGEVTSTADFEFASTEASEVVTTDAVGWTCATAFESIGVATLSEYKFVQPCVDTSKVKSVSLIGIVNPFPYAAYATISRITPTSTSGSVNVVSTTGGVEAGYVSSLSNSQPTYVTSSVLLNSTELHVYVTARCMFIYGLDGATGRFSASLEFPETQWTRISGNTPSVIFAGAAPYYDTGSQFYNPETCKITASGEVWLSSILVYPQWLHNVTRKVSNISGLGRAGDTAVLPPQQYYAQYGKDGMGAGLIPIVNALTDEGMGFNNLSILSGLWYTRTPVSAGYYPIQEGVADGVKYVIITIGTHANLPHKRSFIFKKA